MEPLLKRVLYAFVGSVLAAGCLLLLKYFGVSMGDIAKFILYEIVFIVLPGIAIYALIQPKRERDAKFIFTGWAFGHALSALFYMLCAALGQRSYQALLPIGSLFLFILVHYGINKNKFSLPKLSISETFIKNAALMTACLTVFLLLMTILFYKELPLFEEVVKSNEAELWLYGQDYFFQLGTINEALFHFPITDPRVSNEPLPYYTFFFYHAAAVCDATNLDPSIFYFRLYFIPMIAVIMGLIKSLSSQINKGNVAWIAAIIPFVLGEASMDPSSVSLFFHVPMAQLAVSPTLIMGLMMYLACLRVIYDLVDKWQTASTPEKISLLGMALFFVAICGLTKGVALVNIIGGLLIWVFMDVFILRKKPQIPLLLPAISVAIFIYFSFAYKDIGQRFLFLPLTTIYRQPAFSALFTADMAPFLKTLLGILLIPASLFGIMGLHMVGIIGWKLGNPLKDIISRPEIGLAYQLLASLVCLFAFNNRTFDQVTFLVLGISAAAPLTLAGLIHLFKKARSFSPLPRLAAFALCGVLLILQLGNVPFAYRDRLKLSYKPGNSWGVYSNKLTAGLMNGLLWLRAHSTPDDVIATNDPFGPTGWPASMNISAIAQRRVFLEGWIYSTKSRQYDELLIMTKQVLPFPDRLTLNIQVFEQNDGDALNSLRDKYGVRYLVVDKSRMGKTKLPNKIADSVFSNYAVEIYRVKN